MLNQPGSGYVAHYKLAAWNKEKDRLRSQAYMLICSTTDTTNE